jgi:tRNA U34 5-methylaminomethyl-2-thiouridine-forming methyltransferase MnmC
MKVEIIKPITTNDGSHTLYVKELDEYYHSIHGAIQESLHVFIQSGLFFIQKKEITIFEMGFGTGLNAFLTYLEGKKNNLMIDYYSIEAFPLSLEDAAQLNYAEQLNATDESAIFNTMHSIPWNVKTEIAKGFNMMKIQSSIEQFPTASLPLCDLIYFDAFAPSAQPQLWEEPVLKKMHQLLKENGVLVTYCAKGVFKRTLKSIGFSVEALPGPIGKREITRARKVAQ